MAEKNIKLKDGEDIVYPQTKIGNILNDDGTKLQNFGNAKYWVNMSQYMPLTYERVYTKQLSEEVYKMVKKLYILILKQIMKVHYYINIYMAIKVLITVIIL